MVSGHRGRLYADNAAAVEAEARAQGRKVIWIANAALLSTLKERGVHCLRRHSFAARRAISQAPVLIYSHGEDDLDIILLLLRGRTGLRVYLNHSLNFLKAGGVLDPQFRELPAWLRALKKWLITDCDAFLVSSNKEREHFEKSYPMHKHKMHLSGGAHLDAWCEASRAPTKKQIYWFPTFRETRQASRRLHEEVTKITNSPRLKAWLLAQGYEFLIGTHVNGAMGAREATHPLSPPFFAAPLSQLASDIRESEVFISDYSGMIFNVLFLERPILLFPFDLADYLRGRSLYVDYPDLDFACQAHSAEQLIEQITSEAWRAPELAETARQRRVTWLPEAHGKFATESVKAIAALAEQSSSKSN